VVLNAGAGAAAQAGEALAPRVEAAARAAGFDPRLEEVPTPRLEARLRELAVAPDLDAVIVGGGDGTIRTGAEALAGTGRAMGVLPLGTLNHFARDLGLPPDPEEALRALGRGRVTEVDVAEVNGRVFVNNCSLGLYPEAVRQRELLRARHGMGKWAAMGRGALDALRRFPVSRLDLIAGSRTLPLTTPQVVVGNNRYEPRLLGLAQRPHLDHGELWLYAAIARGRLGFVRAVLRALTGRLDQERDFVSLAAPEVQIIRRSRSRRVRAALDGELVELESPLRLRSRPRALRVLVPAAP
jgi:diacylglycerol kinase family enzyme